MLCLPVTDVFHFAQINIYTWLELKTQRVICSVFIFCVRLPIIMFIQMKAQDGFMGFGYKEALKRAKSSFGALS